MRIKHRATDLKPEAVRPPLRHHGDAPAVLFLTAGNGPGRAIVTRLIGGSDGVRRPVPPHGSWRDSAGQVAPRNRPR
jgi:hypothetical protein